MKIANIGKFEKNLICENWYPNEDLHDAFRKKVFEKKMKKSTVIKCLVEAWLAGLIDIDYAYKKKESDRMANMQRAYTIWMEKQKSLKS